MPIHDWTKISAGTWHGFHLSWLAKLSAKLNTETLSKSYYSQVDCDERTDTQDAVIINEFVMTDKFIQNHITIRKSSDDQIVAMIELISPGNKAGMQAIRAFVDKAVEAIYRGYHLLIVDLFPPTPRDPEGIPALIWSEFAPIPYHLPPGEPLTLSAIDAGHPKHLYVNTTAVGQTLKDMPVFLEPGGYINLPLESTYTAAFQGVPWKWQQVLNPTP